MTHWYKNFDLNEFNSLKSTEVIDVIFCIEIFETSEKFLQNDKVCESIVVLTS